ncbi:unnamed protein product [Amoebophrya sp. A120]|nr:unnamed protein product [Amoebophrya sp. A120]|eukprot:GSA120T00023420001.1
MDPFLYLLKSAISKMFEMSLKLFRTGIRPRARLI